MSSAIKISPKCTIGKDYPCFIIAEAGVNHNGDLALALQLVDVAADAGADAVKFQTFKTEHLITKAAPKAKYHIETTGDDTEQTWFELLKTQELTESMHIALIKRCEERGILFMSTPYDKESVDLLEKLDVALFKIASTDANNISLLEYIAAKGRPVILSTAMCTFDEVKASVEAIRRLNSELVVMQCTGNYPAPISDANLLSMNNMCDKLGVIPGYSDHAVGEIAAIAAVALGACVYEKHFTLDKNLPGPDHRASVEPDELKLLIHKIRDTEQALGNGVKRVMDCEKANRIKLRKSILASGEIPAGTVLADEDIVVKRAGGVGLPADSYHDVVGRVLKADLQLEEPITLENIE